MPNPLPSRIKTTVYNIKGGPSNLAEGELI